MSCRICKNNRRSEIEQGLLNGLSAREIAKMFGFSKSAVHRHLGHIEKKPEGEPPLPLDFQTRLKQHRATLERLLEQAERASDFRAATALLTQLGEIDKRILDRYSPAAGRGGVCSCPNPVIRIIEDSEPTVRNPNHHTDAAKDAWLLASLEDLVKRTQSDQIGAAAVRLASLLSARPLSAEMEIEVSRLEGIDVP